MKHTLGKWYEANTGNHQGLIIDENTGENIAVTYTKNHTALIAAAPELYERLEETTVALANWVRLINSMEQPLTEMEKIVQYNGRLIAENNRNILAKAEGKGGER